jgi:hypothetical protein
MYKNEEFIYVSEQLHACGGFTNGPPQRFPKIIRMFLLGLLCFYDPLIEQEFYALSKSSQDSPLVKSAFGVADFSHDTLTYFTYEQRITKKAFISFMSTDQSKLYDPWSLEQPFVSETSNLLLDLEQKTRAEFVNTRHLQRTTAASASPSGSLSVAILSDMPVSFHEVMSFNNFVLSVADLQTIASSPLKSKVKKQERNAIKGMRREPRNMEKIKSKSVEHMQICNDVKQSKPSEKGTALLRGMEKRWQSRSYMFVCMRSVSIYSEMYKSRVPFDAAFENNLKKMIEGIRPTIRNQYELRRLAFGLLEYINTRIGECFLKMALYAPSADAKAVKKDLMKLIEEVMPTEFQEPTRQAIPTEFKKPMEFAPPIKRPRIVEKVTLKPKLEPLLPTIEPTSTKRRKLPEEIQTREEIEAGEASSAPKKRRVVSNQPV